MLDGFERALSAHDDPAYEEYRKGLEIIYKQLWDTLGRYGLERIEAAGKPFQVAQNRCLPAGLAATMTTGVRARAATSARPAISGPLMQIPGRAYGPTA